MEDEGVVLGTPLGNEDFGHRVGIQAVGTQAVHRFRGDGHQLTGLDEPGRDGGSVRRLGG